MKREIHMLQIQCEEEVDAPLAKLDNIFWTTPSNLVSSLSCTSDSNTRHKETDTVRYTLKLLVSDHCILCQKSALCFL